MNRSDISVTELISSNEQALSEKINCSCEMLDHCEVCMILNTAFNRFHMNNLY